MIVGLGNKVSSCLGIQYALLSPKFRNRNPRAISFQKALSKDMKIHSQDFPNCKLLFKELDFPTCAFLDDFLNTIVQVHDGKLDQSSVIEILQYWQKSKDNLEPGQWLEISMYLLSMGLFNASLNARQLSYQDFNSLKQRLAYNFNHKALLTALFFDKGDIMSANNLAHNLYWKCFFGKLRLSESKNIDPDYFNLIYNKRIAIIGPLEFGKDYSKEIDKYDVIIELNALKSKREGAKKKYHGKPDVVYYNNSRLNELKKIEYRDALNNTKFIVLKNQKHLDALSEISPTRVIPSTTMLNWNGSFSMIENTVADLLLFQPAEIKIYGVNIYTSFNYDKSYGNEPPENLKKITLNFTVHDIFTQYMFMHNLFNLGLIKGDEEFDAVLKLGIKGYVNRMQNLYPKFLLANSI